MATSLEEENVVGVYSKIASHFSDTRVNQWPWITDFITTISKSSRSECPKNILDVGCGNGRNMDGFENCTVYGLDNCMEFIKICLAKGKQNVVHSDMTSLPFPDNYFHNIMAIASFHHLATKERRIQALREYHRVSLPNSRMLLSVWSIRQPLNTKQYKNINGYGDTLVKWNKFGETYERYYYIFDVNELMELFKMTNWLVEKHFWDYGNEVFILMRD